MFLGASAFNQSLNNWDVGQVIFKDCVFANATSFDQSNCNWCSEVTHKDSCDEPASNFSIF